MYGRSLSFDIKLLGDSGLYPQSKKHRFTSSIFTDFSKVSGLQGADISAVPEFKYHAPNPRFTHIPRQSHHIYTIPSQQALAVEVHCLATSYGSAPSSAPPAGMCEVRRAILGALGLPYCRHIGSKGDARSSKVILARSV